MCYLYFVNHGVPTVSLRYFTVYGPRQRPDMGFHKFLKAVMRGQPITVFGDGEQTRDFTFVADAVTATADAAARGVPGRVYNIGGGSRVSLNHVLDLLGAGHRAARSCISREPTAEGRHARHVRRHHGRPGRPGLRPDDRRWPTACARSTDWLMATPLVAQL